MDASFYFISGSRKNSKILIHEEKSYHIKYLGKKANTYFCSHYKKNRCDAIVKIQKLDSAITYVKPHSLNCTNKFADFDKINHEFRVSFWFVHMYNT